MTATGKRFSFRFILALLGGAIVFGCVILANTWQDRRILRVMYPHHARLLNVIDAAVAGDVSGYSEEEVRALHLRLTLRELADKPIELPAEAEEGGTFALPRVSIATNTVAKHAPAIRADVETEVKPRALLAALLGAVLGMALLVIGSRNLPKGSIHPDHPCGRTGILRLYGRFAAAVGTCSIVVVAYSLITRKMTHFTWTGIVIILIIALVYASWILGPPPEETDPDTPEEGNGVGE
jgi:hypothetical protein